MRPLGIWVSPAEVSAAGPGTLGLPAHRGKALRAAWQVTALGLQGKTGVRGQREKAPWEPRAAGAPGQQRARVQKAGARGSQTATHVHEDSTARPRGKHGLRLGPLEAGGVEPLTARAPGGRVGSEQDKATPTIPWVPVVEGHVCRDGLAWRGDAEGVCGLENVAAGCHRGRGRPPRGRIPGV